MEAHTENEDQSKINDGLLELQNIVEIYCQKILTIIQLARSVKVSQYMTVIVWLPLD